ncbi:MAG: hypothetical protein V4773_03200 [Verrucomicrobiota bacterium]
MLPHPRFIPVTLSALSSLLALFAAATAAFAAPDAEPTLGKRGKLLLEEKFEGSAVPAGWTKNTGKLEIHGGSLRSIEVAADNHAAAFRKALPLKDCLIQVDVKLDGPAGFNIGFDPSPGELRKKGHLFSVVINPTGWQLVEHVDKGDATSKNTIHARGTATFSRSEWFTLVLELKGNDVVARIAGKEPLRATAKDFHVKKPGLVFRVSGKTEHAGFIDNVKVWELL